jgi:hypothetical protein
MVYSLYNETLDLDKGQAPTTKNFDLTKETVTVSGTTLFSSIGIDNVTISFNTDSTVFGNTARFNRATSDENGNYEVELKIGSYLVVAESENFEEEGVEYYYASTQNLEVTAVDISLGKSLNIVLEKTLATS